MRSAKNVGRMIGVMLLIQLAGFTVPFILMLPMTKGTSEFLLNAAAIPLQIKLAVDSRWGWVPSGWRLTQLLAESSRRVLSDAKVSSYSINEPIGSEQFR